MKVIPFEEAKQFWADKVKLSPGEFGKLSAEAKVRAFAVSGIAKGDELNTVYNAINKALTDGTPFSDFQRDCATIFEKRGWTGQRAWRVDNIFRTNIQTAYNVGRYQQMMEETDFLPYWMYDAVNDSRTRPTHLAMDGKVFPANSPFWEKWYPPNGFRCRCSVQPLTRGQVERRGLQVETEDPTNTPVFPVDPRTGLTSPVPVQLLPDPGFGYHPGKVVYGGIVDGALSSEGKYRDLPGLPTAADLGLRKLQNIRPAEVGKIDAGHLLPRGLSDEQYLQEFRQRYGNEKVLTDPLGEAAILSERAFQIYKEPGAPVEWKFHKLGHGESIPLIGEMIEDPLEIWLVPQQRESGQVRLSKRYIAAWKTEDKERVAGLAAFDVDKGVFSGVSAFTPKVVKQGEEKWDVSYAERQRHGVLLYRKKKEL